MGGGSSRHVVEYRTVYQMHPETQKQLEDNIQLLKQYEAEAMQQSNPKLFEANSKSLFHTFVDNLPTLKLTDFIIKNTGDHHIGFIGSVSAGKTTLINAIFDKNLPTALGHCTEECNIVHTNDHTVVWDVCGQNDDYKFYNPINLSFIKDLDKCVVVFDNDISMISNFLKIVHRINPNNLVIIRTKVDQHLASHVRTVLEEQKLDEQKVKDLLGVSLPVYVVSAHNVLKATGDNYDWKTVKQKLGLISG